MEAFNKILELDPKSTDAYIVVALNKNEFEQAINTYKKAISMDPEGSESITMARVYKEPEKALETLNKAKQVAEKVQPGSVKFIDDRIKALQK